MAPDGHCLEERFRTHTVPSVGLLAFTHHNAEAAANLPPHSLFIANPTHFPPAADGRALPPLPASAAEVDAISHQLPAGQVTSLEGHNANTAQLLDNLPHATVLHFATHAVLNEAKPYDSFLALDATDHNGKLSIADIYALHLNTRLVVLSACRTGLGKISGDGVDGMSRAFFYAGSASVLTTLGDIADRPAAIIMPRFYAALQQGKSPSEALRSAQLSMLADLRAGRITVETLAGPRKLPPSPAYWAAFSLAGEP
jgi:CHAT domain-containing protein